MFTFIMGDGSMIGPMTADQLSETLDRGITGCGGAGTVEHVLVNDVQVSWETFKAIYNAAHW